MTVDMPERRPLSQLDNKTIGGSYNNLRNIQTTENKSIGSLKSRLPESQKALLEKALVSGSGSGADSRPKSRR